MVVSNDAAECDKRHSCDEHVDNDSATIIDAREQALAAQYDCTTLYPCSVHVLHKAYAYHSKSHPADEKSSLKGAWSGSREQFVGLHCGLRKFRHSKSSVYR